MGKSILSILAALIGGTIITFLFEMIGNSIYPVPDGMDMTNPEVIKKYIQTAPTGALIWVILSWSIATFAAGFIASIIAGKSKLIHAIIVSIVLMMFGIINMLMIPHPVWFWIAGILVYVPLGYLGGKLGAGLSSKKN